MTATPATAPWEERLRLAGRRVTRQRLVILEAVTRQPHSTAEELHRLAATALPGMALPTTHTVVNDLTDSGLLRRVEVPMSPARYEPDVGDNHHHAHCIRCGRIEDVECAVGHAPCLTPQNAHGMTMLVAEVLYRGICAECAASQAGSPAP